MISLGELWTIKPTPGFSGRRRLVVDLENYIGFDEKRISQDA